MKRDRKNGRLTTAIVACAFLCAACGGKGAGEADPAAPGGGKATAAPGEVTLTLAAYTTPREAYGKAIIPAFQKHWLEKKGQKVVFQESYLGSGAQSRAVAGGFEADVVALSLAPDVQRLVDAGFIDAKWGERPDNGMVSRSIAVLAVRSGNPKGIKDWEDLGRADVEVLTPNAKTSGGAMWNVLAMYGAAMRGHVASAKAGDVESAKALLSKVFARVTIMDKGARESMLTFEKGVGDVAITYENEVLVGNKSGLKYDYVVPKSTLLIENPIAVVDKYVDKHGTREIATAFVEFAKLPEQQRAFAEYGLRPVDAAVAAEVEAKLPKVTDLFTVRDLGGWPEMIEKVFGETGVYGQVIASLGR
ncbi:MAG: sulfate ABC transporter substrate-binding protein [Proteobacteria bacterium]|jgi:sulfate transport system substrate-binding protein|nr:sulfate ABC transporter substrate-binding protein [Pseudomonadota bacterium]